MGRRVMMIRILKAVAVAPVAILLGVIVHAAVQREVLERLRSVLREVGVRRTVARLMSRLISNVIDYGFDVRYRTDTSSWVEVADSGASGPNVAHALHYAPTRTREFRRLMSKLDVSRKGAFIDFGSGKGRVLLLASDYGFKRVVGVEFSPALCEIARANVAAYRQRRPGGAPIAVIEGDAAEYNFRDDEDVFYFYSPFDGMVLAAVLDRIVASVRRRPRQVWILYNDPRLTHAVDAVERAGFTMIGQYPMSARPLNLYTNLPGKVNLVSQP
jgi:hypothetical protein